MTCFEAPRGHTDVSICCNAHTCLSVEQLGYSLCRSCELDRQSDRWGRDAVAAWGTAFKFLVHPALTTAMTSGECPRYIKEAFFSRVMTNNMFLHGQSPQMFPGSNRDFRVQLVCQPFARISCYLFVYLSVCSMHRKRQTLKKGVLLCSVQKEGGGGGSPGSVPKGMAISKLIMRGTRNTIPLYSLL